MADPYLLLLVLAAAFFFFGLIPGIGAFSVRSRWRLFRKRMLESSLLPFLTYSDLSRRGGYLGSYRVFGGLEAIQGRNTIWVDSGQFSVEVDLGSAKLYFLPSYGAGGERLPVERLQELLPDEQPAIVSWDRVFSLPAGTQMFVAGALFSDRGRAVFRSRDGEPLLVVLYDGGRETILQRAVWGGRQRNEYWNPFTVPSLLTGSFCMLLLAYVFVRAGSTNLPSLLALSLALFPVLGLLPPGFILYYLYRFCWKRARLLRSERDLLRLPLRYFPASGQAEKEVEVHLPSGEEYLRTEDPYLLIRGRLILRSASLPSLQQGRVGECVLFGAVKDSDGRRWVETPADPMAELVLTLGDPDDLAVKCERRARVFEYLSALFVFSGLAVNLVLVLLVWHLIIR